MSAVAEKKRGRGRPKGSRNKVKSAKTDLTEATVDQVAARETPSLAAFPSGDTILDERKFPDVDKLILASKEKHDKIASHRAKILELQEGAKTDVEAAGDLLDQYEVDGPYMVDDQKRGTMWRCENVRTRTTSVKEAPEEVRENAA